RRPARAADAVPRTFPRHGTAGQHARGRNVSEFRWSPRQSMTGLFPVFDPHPALRATLSQWEREWPEDCPSPIGRGWREAPGEGRIQQQCSQRGAATVYFVLFTIVILGFVALATDVGRMYLIQGELQNAADAAALAAALQLNGTTNALTHADDAVTAS